MSNRSSSKKRQVGQVIAAEYCAPIPPASEFEKYEITLTGAANRILGMAETQSLHRQKDENRKSINNIIQSYIGLILGFIIVIACIFASCYLAINGKEITAGIIGGGTIVSLAIVFVLGKKPPKYPIQ